MPDFCKRCAETYLRRWKGWPHRDVVPYLAFVTADKCGACGGTEFISSENIRWVNVHESGNTGLPNYWNLEIHSGDSWFEKWGRPYVAQVRCSCDRMSILSEFGTPRVEYAINCRSCGVLPLKEDRTYKPKRIEVELLFEENDIRLERALGGVLVFQRGNSYLVRGLDLDDKLEALMEKFLKAGYGCLIRTRHPMPENRETGVPYIGFSLNEAAPWLAVVDQYSGRNPIKRITVNSKFRDLLTAGGIPFRWETAGGQNMFVSVDDIDQLLSLDLTTPAGGGAAGGAPAALMSESELQSLLIKHIHDRRFSDVFGEVKSIIVNPRWRATVGGLDPQAWDIPDVIVETEGVLWVLELKLNEVAVQAAHQVARYVLNPLCLALADGRKVRPVAIGYYKSPELANFNAHEARGVNVSLWTYHWSVERGLELFVS